ncbi:MAG: hydrogenase 3 maturation endopeptidase HyCI [Candidatus Omnitrophota bacterium]
MMNNIFEDILKGKIVIVGVGNTLRGDDGFGPMLIDRLKFNTRLVCINAGSAPENYTGKIIKENPDTILIIDAVHLGLRPGEYDVLRPDEIIKSGFTTHDISPRMFIEFLQKETKADIYLLGVQPGNISFGAEISVEVKRTLEKIKALLSKVVSNRIW